MSGRRKIGSRETYFPPFVNERFDGPPYWACTFSALLNGANVGFLGNREASHAEVRKLARASGDANLSGGSRSSHMITAMRVRYRKSHAPRGASSAARPRAPRFGMGHGRGRDLRRAADALATPHELQAWPPDHPDRLGWQGFVDPRPDGQGRHQLRGRAHPVEQVRAGLVERRTAVVRRGHVPQGATGEGSRQGAGWPMGNPRWLAAHRPSWEKPPRDHAQGGPCRTQVGSFRRDRRGDSEERTVDGRVHPRLERRPRRDAHPRPNAEDRGQAQARFVRCAQEADRRVRRNRRSRLRNPRPKSSSAVASSSTSGSRRSSDRS